ncbi:uncharacterized protein BDV14DRAFT_201341 [Aspergillus stella-maris]|uniref:uncharacterized protein n=1 Tax=Aspergillus stella-maris TaxID=1810926 RepID=UPI003CCE4205
MHVKYLALLALSSAAVAQDWVNVLCLQRRLGPVPSDVSDDIIFPDEYMDNYHSDIETTNDVSIFSYDDDDDDDISPGYSTQDYGSESTFDIDNYEDEYSFSSGSGPFKLVPDDIAAQLISALPTSVFSELMDPSSLASLESEVDEGKWPAWATDLPEDAKNYLETEWGVEVPAAATSGASSGDAGHANESVSSNHRESNEGAAGIVDPSVFGSIVGAAGVLAVALAL